MNTKPLYRRNLKFLLPLRAKMLSNCDRLFVVIKQNATRGSMCSCQARVWSAAAHPIDARSAQLNLPFGRRVCYACSQVSDKHLCTANCVWKRSWFDEVEPWKEEIRSRARLGGRKSGRLAIQKMRALEQCHRTHLRRKACFLHRPVDLLLCPLTHTST